MPCGESICNPWLGVCEIEIEIVVSKVLGELLVIADVRFSVGASSPGVEARLDCCGRHARRREFESGNAA